jgi:hypothetical protein
MTRYEFLVFLHVTAVILWLGAGATMDLLFLRAERLRDPLELKKTGDMMEWLVPRVFIPTAVSTLVLGVAAGWDGPWSFGDLWIVIGLVGWAANFLVGLLFIRPQGEKMPKIVAEYGPMSPQAQRHGKRLAVVSRVQLLALFLVVADMAVKPTEDDVWTLVIGAAVLLAAIAAAVAVLRKPVHGAPAPAESR